MKKLLLLIVATILIASALCLTACAPTVSLAEEVCKELVVKDICETFVPIGNAVVEAESVYEDYAELSICTDYKYAVVEAAEGIGIAWEDLYIYEIQGYVQNGRGLTLILVDGAIRVEEGNEYFLCRTEADLWKLLSFLDYLKELSNSRSI